MNVAAAPGVAAHADDMVDEDDDGEADDDDEAEYDEFNHPPLPELYPNLAGQLVTRPTWNSMRPMWPIYGACCLGHQRRLVQLAPYKGLGFCTSETYDIPPGREISLDTLDYAFIVDMFEFAYLSGINYRKWTKLKTWTNKHIFFELRSYQVIILKGFSVGQIPRIRDLTRMIRERDATHVRDNLLDLQAHLDVPISDDHMFELMMGGLNAVHQALRDKSLLERLQFCAMFSKAFATLNRGGELREIHLGMCYVRKIKVIGGRGGMDCGHFVSNNAKENKAGHMTYKAFARHACPLLDAAAWDGTALFQRFVIQGERFPNFANWNDFATRPLYRAIRNYNQNLQATRMGGFWREYFDEYDIICDKVTHQPRKQGQQMMDEVGVVAGDIARHAGHKPGSAMGYDRAGLSDIQLESYLSSVCIPTTTSAAGGRHLSLETHNPGWGVVDATTQQLLDDLLDMMLPQVRQQLAAAQHRYNTAVDAQDRYDRRLVMGLGAIRYVKFAMERSLLFLASRPVRRNSDNVWTLQADSAVHVDLCANEPRSIFNHRAFRSAEFTALKARVRVEQDREVQRLTHLPLGAETALGQQITQQLTPHFARMDQNAAQVRHETNQEVVLLRQRLVSLEAQIPQLVQNAVLQTMQQFFQNNGMQLPLVAAGPLAAIAPAAPHPQPPIAPPQQLAVPAPAAAATNAAQPPVLDPDNLDPNVVPEVHFFDENQSVEEYWAQYDVGSPIALAYKHYERVYGL
jgi:hypothetical protein